MQILYTKSYLKDLKIQRHFLNRFAWDKAGYGLRQELCKSVRALDKEILSCTFSLEEYEKKKKNQSNDFEQITLF